MEKMKRNDKRFWIEVVGENFENRVRFAERGFLGSFFDKVSGERLSDGSCVIDVGGIFKEMPRMRLAELEGFTDWNGEEYLGGLGVGFEVPKGRRVEFRGLDGCLETILGEKEINRLNLRLLYPVGCDGDVEGVIRIRTDKGEISSSLLLTLKRKL